MEGRRVHTGGWGLLHMDLIATTLVIVNYGYSKKLL